LGMEQIIARLERQQAKLKNLFFCHGALQLMLRSILLVVIFFVLDYSVSPPQGMRIAMSLVVIGYLFYVCFRYLLYPLSRHFSSEDMALALERKFPELDGSLISGLQFYSLEKERYGTMSPALIKQAIDEAGQKAEEVSWRSLFETKSIKKLAVVCAALFVLAAGYAFANPGLVGIFAARAVGIDTEWPRRTTLLVEIAEAGENFKLISEADPYNTQEVLMVRGASLPVNIKVDGKDPEEVLVMQDSDSLGGVISKASPKSSGDYHYLFRNVREDMTFYVKGGDDDGHGRVVDVQVAVPPEILSISSEYTFPEYFGKETEIMESSQVEGPEGTDVVLHFALSKPVIEASITLRFGAQEQTELLTLNSDDPLKLDYKMKLAKSGVYRMRLTGEKGFSNIDAPLHSIIVRKDQRPNLKLYYPRSSDLDLCKRGVAIFRVFAEDDYGIAEMNLIYKSAGEETAAERVFSEEEISSPWGSKRIISGTAFDFDSIQVDFKEGPRKLEPGDTLIYTIEAYDARPDRDAGKSDTGQNVINIVSVNEKIRILTERQIRLKEDVKGLRNLQTERLEKSVAALEEIDTAQNKEQVLISLEIGQNQLTNRYSNVTKDLAYIFDDYLFNRLDKTSAAAALLEKAILARLDTPVSDAFNPSIYRSLVNLRDSGEVGEMDLMERIINLLRLSFLISHDHSPEAAGHLAKGLTSTDVSDYPGLIELSINKQKEIIAVLDELLQKMEEWEDYQELLQLFRDVIDTQHNLNIMTREELRKRK